MPILDGYAKASAPNSAGVSVAYAFQPEALNRGMLIAVLAAHDTNRNYPSPTVTYAGLGFDAYKVAQNISEQGGLVHCILFWRSLLLGEQPLSGQVVVTLGNARNLIVYAVGLRGIDFPDFEDSISVNGAFADSVLVLSNLNPNDYLGLLFAASSSPVSISSTAPPEMSVLDASSVGSGLGGLMASMALLPTPQHSGTWFMNGNVYHALAGWSVNAPLPVGEPVPLLAPAIGSDRPYRRNELRFRTGMKEFGL